MHVFSAVLLAACLAAPEIDKFQGKWGAITYVEAGEGDERFDPAESPVRFEFEEEAFTIGADVEEATVKGTVKLGKDNVIDLIVPPASEGEKEQTMKGIYEIDGDTLRLCYGLKDRPEEFKSTEKNGFVLIEFKRLK